MMCHSTFVWPHECVGVIIRLCLALGVYETICSINTHTYTQILTGCPFCTRRCAHVLLTLWPRADSICAAWDARNRDVFVVCVCCLAIALGRRKSAQRAELLELHGLRLVPFLLQVRCRANRRVMRGCGSSLCCLLVVPESCFVHCACAVCLRLLPLVFFFSSNPKLPECVHTF